MRTFYTSYSKQVSKSLSKCCFLFLTAIVLSSIFASCTADEIIKVEPQTEAEKESFFQRKDTLINTNDSNTPIIPPINPPVPPKP